SKRRAYIGTYGEESIFYWIFQGCRPQALQTTSHALPVTWDSGAFYWIAFAGSRVKCPKLFSSSSRSPISFSPRTLSQNKRKVLLRSGIVIYERCVVRNY
ncbi:hypothetical protein FWK35_00032884, partial [Aphis craccivora]